MRKLSPEELAGVMDVPILLQDWLKSAGLQWLLHQFIRVVPGKSLLFGADVLLATVFRGGCSYGMSLDEHILGNGGSPDIKLGRKEPTLQAVQLGVKTAYNDDNTTIMRNSTSTAGEVLKCYGQKADDAEIPTHLWNVMFKLSWEPDPLVKWAIQPNWEEGLELFRNALLLVWRRRVLRSWIKFSTRFVPAPFMAKLGTHVNWVKCLDKLTYTWSSTGLTQYQRWHKFRVHRETNLKKAIHPARDCMLRATECTWWEWAAGSTLFFWHWPSSHLVWAREGQPHFTLGPMPKFQKKQAKAKLDQDQKKISEKVDQVRVRN
jgi:hypothetical protein